MRDLDRHRATAARPEILTDDFAAIRDDGAIAVVAEVMGGVSPTREWMLELFAAGKSVVTANKQLLARHGAELFAAAEEHGVQLRFEASVCAAIPVVKVLRESMIASEVSAVLGIVNGTTNFMLTKMADGADYASVLAEAQRLGYAEADPTADVEGHDAASKCAILASIAFGARVTGADVHREGISRVSADDIRTARRLGYVVKLLAIAELGEDGRIAARVHPSLVPVAHPLASVRDATNAVFVEGPNIGELMFSGRGAGGAPTATAVVGDIVEAARNLRAGTRGIGCTCTREGTVRPMAEGEGQFLITLLVVDRPGALADIARVFADRGVSIKDAWQEGADADARLVFVTHRAGEGAFQSAVGDLHSLPAVREVRSVLRVVAEE